MRKLHTYTLLLICCLLTITLCAANAGNSNNKKTINTTLAKDDKEPKKAERIAKPTGITFRVDSVDVTEPLLVETDVNKLIEYKSQQTKTLFIPAEHKSLKIVGTSGNALIETLQECYGYHRPLALSPDAIWLAICQGTALHINVKIDSLEHIIFQKDKPKELAIRNDSLEHGGQHWQSLIESLSSETERYAKENYYSFFVSDFSTTTNIEKTAYQIALLEGYKQLFTYVGDTGCGIPSITLSGTKEDWVTIYKKLDQLDDLGLGWWADILRPIIREFVNVFDGETDTKFWKSIYKDRYEYNAFYISGWFIKFFPYIIIAQDEIDWEQHYDMEKGGIKISLNYSPNPFISGDDYLLSHLSTNDFPSGLSEIDVVWNNYFNGTTEDIEVYSGFFGIRQYDDKTLEPFISWAICNKKDKASDKVSIEIKNVGQKENEYRIPLKPIEYWAPRIAEEPIHPPIYNSKKFKTQSESLDYIKGLIEKAISKRPEFKNKTFKNIKTEFIVLSNGRVTRINIVDSNNIELNSFIQQQLINLPAPWLPALANPNKVLELMDEEAYKKKRIKVNSSISFTLFEE